MYGLTGYSGQEDVAAALGEACAAFINKQPKLIVFFTESTRFAAFTRGLAQLFPESQVLGAASYVSFSPAGVSSYGIQVAALFDLEVATGRLDELKTYPLKYKPAVEAALASLAPFQPQPQNTCCFTLTSAGTDSEELMLDTLKAAFGTSGIPVCGGSASSPAILRGEVSLNGVVYQESTVFALLCVGSGRLHIQQENIFEPLGRELTATKVDVEAHTIYELDGHKAAEVLCKLLKVPDEKLGEALALHPFGRIAGDRLFVSEIKSVNPDGSITTYCRIFNQSPIAVLQMIDTKKALQETLSAIHRDLTRVDFSLMVNCFRRSCLYAERGEMESFARQLHSSLGPYLGLTSYGEQLDTYQLSLTMLILSFGV
jgi:hypothetical protein